LLVYEIILVKPFMSRTHRADLISRLGPQLGRELSTRTILFHQAVADCLGITPTDHKCLGFIADADHPVTAGELATLTGLTSGAITGVIDRLERAALARRQRDPQDRRRVVVKPAASAIERIGPLFESLSRASLKLAAKYTDHELEIIERYVLDCVQMLKEETKRLRDRAHDPVAGRARRGDRAQPSSSYSSSSGGPSRVEGRNASR
jgi:DNA-binding MarR family transcriptional regulator